MLLFDRAFVLLMSAIHQTLAPASKEHWPRHKKPCKAQVVAAAAKAKFDRETNKAAAADKCLICLDAPVDPIELPCKHSFCRKCMEQLREKGVSQACPLCRAPLPPGEELLFDMGFRIWNKMATVVGSNKEWPALTSEQQSEMNGGLLMLQEAMAQVRVASCVRKPAGTGRCSSTLDAASEQYSASYELTLC